MLTRLLTIFMLAMLSVCSLKADVYEYDSNPVCGKYVATDGGAVVEIVPMMRIVDAMPADLKVKYSLSAQYAIILQDNPSPMLEPGTIMGWLAPLAKPGMYDGVVYTKEKNGRLASPRKFLFEMNADGSHLSMVEIKNRLRVDPLRFLPYLFHGLSLKGTLKMEDNRRDDVDGFLKIYPRPVNPASPRPL